MVARIGLEYLEKLKEVKEDEERLIKVIGIFKHLHYSVRRFIITKCQEQFVQFMPYHIVRFFEQWNEKENDKTVYLAYHKWYTEEERLGLSVFETLKRRPLIPIRLLEVCTIIVYQDMSYIPQVFNFRYLKREQLWVLAVSALYAQNNINLCFYNSVCGDCRKGMSCRFLHRCLLCDKNCPQSINKCRRSQLVSKYFSEVLAFDLPGASKFEYLRSQFTLSPFEVLKVIAKFTLINGRT